MIKPRSLTAVALTLVVLTGLTPIALSITAKRYEP